MEGGGARDPTQLLAAIKSREEIEGFVILFQHSSQMYKANRNLFVSHASSLFADSVLYAQVKTDWYFARANQKKSSEFSFSSERGVWSLVLNQQMDDAAAFMDPVLKKAVQDFSDALYAGELIDLVFLSLSSVHSSFCSAGRFGSARVCVGERASGAEQARLCETMFFARFQSLSSAVALCRV